MLVINMGINIMVKKAEILKTLGVFSFKVTNYMDSMLLYL